MSQSNAIAYLERKGWHYEMNGDQAKVAICPLCKKDKFHFYINTTGNKDGLWACHYCGKSGNLKTLQSNPDPAIGEAHIPNVRSMKDWANAGQQPDPLPDYERCHAALMEDDDALDYLYTTRGFSPEVVQKMKLGVQEYGGKKWLVIPYFDRHAQYTFCKFRTLPPADKDFRSPRHREAGLYNEECIRREMDELVIVEGECLLGDTEVLTPNGWVRLDEYSNQPVAQWNEDGTANFVKPLAYIAKEYEGQIVNFSSKSKVIDLATTENHRVLYSDMQFRDQIRKAVDVPNKRARFYRTAQLESDGIPLSDWEIRLAVVIQADATHENPEVNVHHYNASGGDGWTLELNKERKINRLREILTALGMTWSEYPRRNGLNTAFRFRTPRGRYAKRFHDSFYQMNTKQRRVFTDEIPFWDGHARPSGEGVMYQSTVSTNADVVQWAFAMSGVYAKRGVYNRAEPRQPLHWVSVHLNKNRGCDELTNPRIDKTLTPYKGWVYCVQVPSSFIVTRRNGAICITGNCDALSCLSNGVQDVVGVPGANVQKASWIGLLDAMKPRQIYILYDTDHVGQKAAQQLAQRIGVDRCLKITLPEFCRLDGQPGKDINEWFLAGHTAEDFQALKEAAVQFDVEGVVNAAAAMDELEEEILDKGELKGTYQTPWKELGEIIGAIEPGDVVALMAEAKCGKTTMADQWAEWFAANYASSMHLNKEMLPKRLVRKLVSRVTQTDDIPGNITIETIKHAKALLADRKHDLLYCYSKGADFKKDADTIRQTVRRYGVKMVVIDNLQCYARSVAHQANEIFVLSKMVKELAMELAPMGVWILLIVQPNRPREGEIVAARNAAGSSGIEKDVDCLIVAHRNRIGKIKADDFTGFMETNENFEPQLLLRADLTRYASGGVRTLLFDGAKSTITSLPVADRVVKQPSNDFTLKDDQPYVQPEV